MRRARILVLGIVTAIGLATTAGACGSFDSDDPAVAAADAAGEASLTPDASTSSDGDAGSTDGPSARDASDGRIVFLSSEEYVGAMPYQPGELDGLAAADRLCKGLADKVPALSGRQWRAWLSSTRANAVTRALGTMPIPTDVRLTDGTVVFPKGFVLDTTADGGVSAPSHPINMTEKGTVLRATEVWTGCDQLGRVYSPAHTCNDWRAPTDDAGPGEALTGWAELSPFEANWTATGSSSARSCTNVHRLYCFEAP